MPRGLNANAVGAFGAAGARIRAARDVEGDVIVGNFGGPILALECVKLLDRVYELAAGLRLNGGDRLDLPLLMNEAHNPREPSNGGTR